MLNADSRRCNRRQPWTWHWWYFVYHGGCTSRGNAVLIHFDYMLTIGNIFGKILHFWFIYTSIKFWVLEHASHGDYYCLLFKGNATLSVTIFVEAKSLPFQRKDQMLFATCAPGLFSNFKLSSKACISVSFCYIQNTFASRFTLCFSTCSLEGSYCIIYYIITGRRS